MAARCAFGGGTTGTRILKKQLWLKGERNPVANVDVVTMLITTLYRDARAGVRSMDRRSHHDGSVDPWKGSTYLLGW